MKSRERTQGTQSFPWPVERFGPSARLRAAALFFFVCLVPFVDPYRSDHASISFGVGHRGNRGQTLSPAANLPNLPGRKATLTCPVQVAKLRPTLAAMDDRQGVSTGQGTCQVTLLPGLPLATSADGVNMRIVCWL